MVARCRRGLVGVVTLATACSALAACSAVANRPATLATESHPAPTATVTTSTTAAWRSYTVVRGDSLTAVAKRFGLTVDALAAANSLTNVDVLAVGQVLRIPPVPSFSVTVTPSSGPAGTSFVLRVTGLEPADTATFSIAAPGKHPFTGPQHSPAPDGSVSATYQTWPTDVTGTYTVLAHASSGKGAYATFNVEKPPPSASPLPP